ncbi:MAG TPA: hypothetical protein VNG53_01335 [Bacteroidia bacterium]|nr:hypothetical protein [Bacteroidia bacterium]
MNEGSAGSEVVEVRDGEAGSARERKVHGFVDNFSQDSKAIINQLFYFFL